MYIAYLFSTVSLKTGEVIFSQAYLNRFMLQEQSKTHQARTIYISSSSDISAVLFNVRTNVKSGLGTVS